MSSKTKDFGIAVGILVLALVARIYKLMIAIAPNGVDEGIHLMQGRLLSQGFSLYDQTFSLQAPVAIFLYALINGELFLAKLLSIFSSLVAIALVMYLAREFTDTLGMTVAGLLLSVELFFLKESRLASIDMLCSAFLVVGFFFLFRYVENENCLNLVPAGVFLALASLTKLFAVLPTILAVFYLIWKTGRRSMPFQLAVVGTTVVIMAPLNLQAAFSQMIFSHTYKEWLLIDRFVILGQYLVLNLVLIGLACVGIWALLREPRKDKDATRRDLLFIWLLPMTAFIIAQGMVMSHHLVLLSPILALFASYGAVYIVSLDIFPSRLPDLNVNRPRIVACLMGVVLFTTTLNVAIISSLVFLEPKPRETPQYLAAEILEIITSPDDLVISGDPEIPLLADRRIPPELVDTAKNRYPPLTGEYLINRTIENNVVAVVIAYALIDFIDYVKFLETNFLRDLRVWNIDPSVLRDLEDNNILIFVSPDLNRAASLS